MIKIGLCILLSPLLLLRLVLSTVWIRVRFKWDGKSEVMNRYHHWYFSKELSQAAAEILDRNEKL